MEKVKSQMKIGENVLHVETDAECVKYGSSNAKAMMDGMLSSANLSAAVQMILKAKNYEEACRALKVAPEKFFDEKFNSWTFTGAPTVANGSIDFSGTSTITSETLFNIGGGDFSAQIEFTTGTLGTAQCLYYLNPSGNAVYTDLRIDASGNLYPEVKVSSINAGTKTAISANTKYFWEVSYDSANTTWYFFLNGNLLETKTIAYKSASHQIRMGGSVHTPPKELYTGSIQEFRLSDCVRHTTNHSTGDYFELDDNTLSLMHFD